jgi:hypothetical protein
VNSGSRLFPTRNNEVRGFYRRFGFEDLPHDPRRSMIVRIKDLEGSGEKRLPQRLDRETKAMSEISGVVVSGGFSEFRGTPMG